MRRAATVLPAGGYGEESVVDRVVLDHDQRHRRRIVLETASTGPLLLDLAETRRLRHGEGLLLEDGGVVRIEAAPEALVEITAADRDALLRIAWHLGNRHLPTQLLGDRLRIRDDHVIVELVRGLGGQVAAVSAPFDPEGGAYGQGAVEGHHHDHHHPHDHGHEHHHGGAGHSHE